MLTDSDVVRIVRTHLEGKFPKHCSCGRRFETLRDYLLVTRAVGTPVMIDEPTDHGGPPPDETIGPVSFANCPCGSTLALGSDGIPMLTLLSLMRYALHETRRRGITSGALLAELRARIDAEVLK